VRLISRLVIRRGLPFIVWGVTVGVIAAAAYAFGYDPFDSNSWSRWDSEHYLGIARDGYDLYRCPLDYAPDPGGWCGDAGWFPGYPWLFGAAHRLGLPLQGTAVFVSWAFAAATLVLLWNTFFARRRDVLTVGALVYAAWAPGQIYDYAIFPMSMLAFFTVAHLWLLTRRRYVWAGVTAAAAALTYPLGVLLIPVSALWLFWQRRFREAVTTGGIGLTGVIALALDQRLETGHWNAYLLVQRKYHHNLQNPIAATWDYIRPLLHGSPFQYAKGPAWQTATVTAALLIVVIYAVFRQATFGQTERLILFWALVSWVVPLSQGALSIQRSQAALLPLAILLRRLPRPLLFALVLGAVLAALAMENLFFHGDIV
jgi:hypothetical protein